MKPKKIIMVGFTVALVLPLGGFSHTEEFEAPHVHMEVIDGPHEAMLTFLGVPSITGNVVDVARPFQTTYFPEWRLLRCPIRACNSPQGTNFCSR